MDEIEEIPLETAEGARPRSTVGDRLIVGLAGLVLLGGVLIAATNFLGELGPPETAATSQEPSATATPRPSRTPRPSPTPRPLRDVTVRPGTPVAPPSDESGVQMGWLQILVPTVERAAPSSGADEVEELAAGEILLAYLDPPGWASPFEPQTGMQSGYVQLADADGNAIAAFYPVDNQAYPGQVEWVSAGPDGLLASVWPPQRQYLWAQPMLIRSADGEHWTAVKADPAFTSMSPRMAWGPEGWIALSVSPTDSAPWVWQSFDGEDWDAVGAMGPGLESGWPSRLVASGLGYVLLYEENQYSGTVTTTWFSRDGVYWQESADPFGRSESERRNGEGMSMLATDAGFVAWTMSYDFARPVEHRVAFSQDGLHWSSIPMEDPELRGDLQLAASGRTLLAVGRTLDGAVRAWSTRPVDGLSWQLRRDRGMEVAFEDTLGVSLVGSSTHAYALGYESSSAAPAIWRSDGSSFRRLRLPDPIPFGAAESLGAVGPAGLVLIGSQTSVIGESPVFWHLRDDGTWHREADPIIPVLPDPTPDDCGPLPSSALEFAVLAPTWGPACFGDAPMTFTAWAARCDWCPERPMPSPVGSWLMEAGPGLLLRPVAGDDWPYAEAVLHPSLELPPGVPGTWVLVTGHFDDPAAAECAYPPDPGNFYATPVAAVSYCRQRFVVTELTVVDGP